MTTGAPNFAEYRGNWLNHAAVSGALRQFAASLAGISSATLSLSVAIETRMLKRRARGENGLHNGRRELISQGPRDRSHGWLRERTAIFCLKDLRSKAARTNLRWR